MIMRTNYDKKELLHQYKQIIRIIDEYYLGIKKNKTSGNIAVLVEQQKG